MKLLKIFEDYIINSNKKAFKEASERYGCDDLPVEMELIETRSGIRMEFVNDQSKLNLGEKFRRALNPIKEP